MQVIFTEAKPPPKKKNTKNHTPNFQRLFHDSYSEEDISEYNEHAQVQI